MQNSLLLKLSMIILILNISSSKLCGNYSEVSEALKTEFNGKSLEEMTESVKDTAFSFIEGQTIFKLNTTRDLYFLISEYSEEMEKKHELLKKLTLSYGKEEEKPFTSFVECAYEDKQGAKLVLVFEGFGESLFESESAHQRLNINGFKMTSNLYKLLNRLKNLNMIPQNFLEYILVDDKGNMVNFLAGQLFEGNSVDFIPSRIIRAPEENISESPKTYWESFNYKSIIIPLFFIEEFPNYLGYFEEKYHKDLLTLFKENTTEEQNSQIVDGLVHILDVLKIEFTQPSGLTKFVNSFMSLFTNNAIARSYDLQTLIKNILIFDRKKRSNELQIAEKLEYFSNNQISKNIPQIIL